MFLTKRTLKYLFFACLLLVLSSCKKKDNVSNNTLVNTIVEENTPTESVFNTQISPDIDDLEKRAYNSEFIEIQSGDSFDFDLDGKKERIEYRFIKNDMNYVEDCEVKIGNVICTTPITNPTGKVYISSLTRYQNSLQILVDEYGPSNDYMTTILYYWNNELTVLGTVGGIVTELKALGDGMIQSMERTSTLQTWYHPRKFYLITDSIFGNDHEKLPLIIYMPNELYAVGTKVKLLRDVPLLFSQYDNVIKCTLNKDSDAIIVASDDEKWIYVQGSDAYYSGWVEIEGLDVIINETTIYGQDVFDGLWIAD